MQTEISTAVIGFGLGGRVFHAPFISAVPGLHLSAIVQRTGDTAAQAYPTTRILRSVDDLFADTSIQLIVVATPNATHFDLAKRALEAGKHVVIDKPFAATSAQALELMQIADKHKLHLFAFHNRRWDGDFQTVQQILTGSALGRLVTLESHFDRYRPTLRENTWKESQDPANGMLFDLGPHLMDQALYLFGKPEALTASVRTDRDHSVIEDAFDITLHYSKLLVHLRATMLASDPSPRFLLHGTHGSFRKYGTDPQEPALNAGKSPAGDASWGTEPESAWGTLTTAPDIHQPGQLTTQQIPTLPGDYRGYYASVRDAILGKPNNAVTARDGYRTVRLLELARQSSAAAKTIPITAQEWDASL